ncbi:MAG TPA: hypothetical protein VNY09_02915 [Candidatus Sulfotelmatobacter sp.]|nr:hypothetical protein [Candidatus Sulfotelmatobacter sp.]
MTCWRFCALLILAAVLGAAGCGSSSSSGVSLTISPTTASVITNRTQQFSGIVTGSSNTAITWSLTCETGVTANTCGSIDAAGLYTAPGTLPTVTSNGTTTAAPTVTIMATAQADTTKTATATLTIVTGISIAITPTTATVGTTENFTFTASVNNPGCNTTSTTTCDSVTWSLSTTLTGIGTIGSTTGVYTAPGSVPTPSSTVIITATSVSDTSVTATATVTVVTAAQPTVTSVSPNTTAVGGLFQDVYITGTNFISTNFVYVNHARLSPTLVTQVTSSLIRARIPDFILAAPPSPGFLQIGVSEQAGTEQACSGSDQSPCEITMVNARPGVVGLSPGTIPQGSGVQSFAVDGGFFGTGLNPADPAVTATYNGQLRGLQLTGSQTVGSTRHLSVTIGGGSNSSDLTVPGLYPVAIQNARDTTKFAVTNLAVQPNYNGGSSISSIANLAVGATPSAVAINAATGVAVVANTGSNDITVLNIAPTSGTPSVIASICTYAVGLAEPCPTSTPSGPTSVAVDDVRNEALVVNSASNSVAVVDLNSKTVTTVIPLQDTPGAVGVNPLTGRALVAMQEKDYGVLLDLTVNPPAVAGIVSISTGTNTKVAVEPHLDWAVVTPGGAGSLAIVELSNQSSNTITAVSRTTNVVTVTVQSNSSAPPISVQQGDTVQIANVQFPASTDSTVAALAPTFDGFYTVSAVGPGPNQFSYTQTAATQTDVATQSTPQAATGSVNSSEPVRAQTAPTINVQGIAINPETQQAVLVDPTTGGQVTFLNLLDQSIASVSLKINNNQLDVGTNAVAYNPLTNTIVAVNETASTLSVIDPTTHRRLNDGNLYTALTCPAAVAVDPGTNIAVVVNQFTNPPVCNTGAGSVSILNLGPIQAFSISDTSPRTFVSTSTLGSGPNPAPQTITVIGTGFGAACTAPPTTSLQVRLDGTPLSTSCNAAQPDRVLTATVPTSMLTMAHRYALDVFNSSNSQVTNAEDFTVEQSVDVSTACTLPPEPAGVAIDPQQNLAAVSLFGCNELALINLSTGTGSLVTVGQNPIGVAVLPRLHYAVVANNGGAGTASIVDELQQSVKQTVATGSSPFGAAANEATGEVAIANSVANTVTVVNAVSGGTSTISTGQTPIAVGFNYVNDQVAAAAATGGVLSVSGGTTGSASQSFSVTQPTSVIYDPVPEDCESNGTTTNTTGCFIVTASGDNAVQIIDPVTSIQNSFGIGINPTSIAYNYFTSTLVSTNTASHTISVADLRGLKVLAALSLPPIVSTTSNQALVVAASSVPQYAVDVHPLTNIAVIADTANGRVLFVPLPR